MLAPANQRSEIEVVLYSYLTRRFPALASCQADTPVLENGAVDSLGMLELMMFLGDHFGIVIDDEDFDLSNLGTPARLIKFIERKRS